MVWPAFSGWVFCARSSAYVLRRGLPRVLPAPVGELSRLERRCDVSPSERCAGCFFPVVDKFQKKKKSNKRTGTLCSVPVNGLVDRKDKVIIALGIGTVQYPYLVSTSITFEDMIMSKFTGNKRRYLCTSIGYHKKG